MKDIYTEYALLEADIAEKETKKAQLRELILNEMSSKGVLSEKTPFGNFSIAKLTKWTFSKKVDELNEKAKALAELCKVEQAKEISAGIATGVEKDSLRFTPVKL